CVAARSSIAKLFRPVRSRRPQRLWLCCLLSYDFLFYVYQFSCLTDAKPTPNPCDYCAAGFHLHRSCDGVRGDELSNPFVPEPETSPHQYREVHRKKGVAEQGIMQAEMRCNG